MTTTNEVLALMEKMDPERLAKLEDAAKEAFKDHIWIANPGPQYDAFFCPADLLLYGGQGGGGKTDLLGGLSLTQHQRSLILRPQYTDLGAIIDRFCGIAGTKDGLNRSPPAQFKYDGRIIDFGAAATLDGAETWQGNPHDLIGFDEACQFLEIVVRFLMGWNRAADQELGREVVQRSRTVLASNPPLGPEGEWIIGMFRPWLDLTHEDPAAHGELRWYVTDPDGMDMEVGGPQEIREWGGGLYIPKSRTFIPAALSDNPFLINTGYQATLDAMPEPLRSAVRDGNFMAAREDDAFQVIPTKWVIDANDRWRNMEKPRIGQSSIGLDVARGGKDSTVFSPRYGTWFDEQTIVAGRNTPDGTSVAVLAAGILREGGIIGIDNIGIGADAETALKNAQLPFEAMNGAEGATAHTRDGAFGFLTRRSEMWWMLREALDPDYGFDLAIPPDHALMADLTTPTYEVRPGRPPKIYVEGTKEMMRRLGRSPDRGSAMVYSWNCGELNLGGKEARTHTMKTPRVDSEYDMRNH
jgi:hypothetical protein